MSRDDLVIGDVVAVSSLDGATTYNWTLVFAPDGSTATFSGSGTAVSPGSFTVDLVGPYLVRLVVDVGLLTQSTQYVRLRAKTTSLGLCLVAAGERRDGSGIIPVDVSAEGWANEQNENLLKLEAAIAGSDWATTLMVGSNSGGSNPTLTPGDVMVFGTSPAAGVSAVNQGRLRYSQTSGSFQTSVNGGAWANIGGGGPAPDDNHQFEATVFPGNTINSLWFAPYDCEVVGVRVYGQTSPTTAGVYTLAVEDLDASNNILSVATFDLTSLTAATLTTVALTGTGADLLLSAGTRVRFQFVSDNGDLVATGLYTQIIYRSQ